MTKKNIMWLLVLVIVGGAIGGAIVFLTQGSNATQAALPTISMDIVRYHKLI